MLNRKELNQNIECTATNPISVVKRLIDLLNSSFRKFLG